MSVIYNFCQKQVVNASTYNKHSTARKKSAIHIMDAAIWHFLKEVVIRNPTIYNIIRWFAGTNESSTKRLMFQALFFS
jgi:hypothetical protein